VPDDVAGTEDEGVVAADDVVGAAAVVDGSAELEAAGVGDVDGSAEVDGAVEAVLAAEDDAAGSADVEGSAEDSVVAGSADEEPSALAVSAVAVPAAAAGVTATDETTTTDSTRASELSNAAARRPHDSLPARATECFDISTPRLGPAATPSAENPTLVMPFAQRDHTHVGHEIMLIVRVSSRREKVQKSECASAK
jgi:hypothetical protein